jgi:hypothetical protein
MIATIDDFTERHHETIAEGRPGAPSPIAGSQG